MDIYVHLVVFWLTVVSDTNAVRVRVQQGILEGETLKSFMNNSFASFKGIPYAAPPIAKLRFTEPQPPLSWSGVRNATSHGPVCPQVDIFSGQNISGSEDCLFINVYSPDVDPDTPLPVMVFIHGGGFKSGSGNDDFYGPIFLMDYGIVLATLNYRLEVFGFLSLQNKEVPGNNGLKDQVAALRWIQRNIRKFGGDPDNVTIFGQSAGGASVMYHVLFPTSKRLFKRAISMSGVPFCDFAIPFRPRDKAFILGKQLGIATDDSTVLVNYLKNVSSVRLYDVDTNVLTSQEITNNVLKMYNFVPVIERDCDSKAFLSKSPEDIIRCGLINDVDIMIGSTDKEALTIIDAYEKAFMPTYDRYPEMVVPTKILYKRDPETILNVSKIIRKHFFGNKTINGNVMTKFIDYVTESTCGYDVDRFVKAISKVHNKPIYKYRFSAVSGRNFYGNAGLKYGISGAAHLDDLLYLFEAKSLNQKIEKESEDYVLVQRICTLLTNFVKYGNPTPDNSLGALWPKYDSNNECYMEIGNTLIPSSGQPKSTLFWKSVFDYVGLTFYP